MNSKLKIISVVIVLTAALSPFVFFVSVYNKHYEKLTDELKFNPVLPTTIYDIRGNVISRLYEEMRLPVKIADVPDTVKNAFIAAEDSTFYRHSGLDFIAIARAMIINIVQGSIKQGGSTITQQVIKQFYTDKQKTFERKIVEVLLVQKIEKNYSKDEILEIYLNQIYFGHGIYGIKSAAKFYFNTDVNKLDIYQASLLAIIPPAPNRFSPLKNPEIAFEKHKTLIYNLIDTGKLYKDDAAENFTEFWKLYLENINSRSPSEIARSSSIDRAPNFTEMIRTHLIETYGVDEVYKGGKKIYTTLDLEVQAVAERIMNEKIEEQNKKANIYNKIKQTKQVDDLAYKANETINEKEVKEYVKVIKYLHENIFDELNILTQLQDQIDVASLVDYNLAYKESADQASSVEGALIAIVPKTGQIVAMVGGSNFNYGNQFNRVLQARRQPGSAFKTFLYTAGLESKKITLATSFIDEPLVFNYTKKKDWKPKNANDKYLGKVQLRKAFALSINTVAILAYEEIGGRRIADISSKMMNVPKDRFTVDPTLALGTSEFTPMEMVTGYSVIANEGKDVKPFSIIRITDSNDNVVYEATESSKQKQIISRETAYIMTTMLRSVVDNGTATRAIKLESGYTKSAAGKTGTNKDARDAWFVGYIPGLACAVWVGCDSQVFSLGYKQYGSNVAAPIWGKFIKEADKYYRKGDFQRKPDKVKFCRVCIDSGNLAAKGCSSITEYFVPGTDPKNYCDQRHMNFMSIYDIIETDSGTESPDEAKTVNPVIIEKSDNVKIDE